MSKEMREAFKKLLSLPMPQINMVKVRAAMKEHNETCGLCRLLRNLPRG